MIFVGGIAHPKKGSDDPVGKVLCGSSHLLEPFSCVFKSIVDEV